MFAREGMSLLSDVYEKAVLYEPQKLNLPTFSEEVKVVGSKEGKECNLSPVRVCLKEWPGFGERIDRRELVRESVEQFQKADFKAVILFYP